MRVFALLQQIHTLRPSLFVILKLLLTTLALYGALALSIQAI